jgi:hypothetical protein
MAVGYKTTGLSPDSCGLHVDFRFLSDLAEKILV